MKQLTNTTLTFLLLFVMAVNGYGQNLVPNPSFEQYSSCPSSTIGVQLSTGWNNANTGTADYFNSCFTTGGVSFDVPSNFMGVQNAKTGNAYAGIMAYEKSGSPINYREYIQSQLASVLVGGIKYYVSFNLSHADNSCFITDDIGVHLSNNQINQSNFFNINSIPQIENIDGNFLNDNTNWIRIHGSFIATGGEKYLIIGNFKNDVNTDTSSVCNTSNLDYRSAYYYIDDVCLSADSLLCANFSSSTKENTLQNQIKIYPNPANNYINITKDNNLENFNITIYNSIGQTLYNEQKISSYSKQINIINFNSGLLFIKIESNNNSFTYKLLKQ